MSEVVDVITVHVEDHGLGELLRNLWLSKFANISKIQTIFDL